jgi:hypothetical protein
MRTVKVGSKVFINPIGKKQIGNGRPFDQFEIFAEGLEPLGDPTRSARSAGGALGGGALGAGSEAPGGALPSEDVPF